ncbi:unnamed protein product [Pleuronectes platessa]|uniref:Uncharacterized protein n=1 Tax=Pleuronectes platessa TaxID=8262 RepID=A0A9N7TK83_PLEPL|nr:unnamed protein product [Pleuronectes platessa]
MRLSDSRYTGTYLFEQREACRSIRPLLSSDNSWKYLKVLSDLPAASSKVVGLVPLVVFLIEPSTLPDSTINNIYPAAPSTPLTKSSDLLAIRAASHHALS